ncbi:MAG TPA: alpha-L-fucosidase [Plantibacter sp.]|uniref:alpha-L-fucosidase n=1 Tax=unclassified Plantibacter TaxID=2624265 RepID=UPI002B808583|nr:alpha-L-fucosidase [Plantibacter sp.]
MTDYEPTWASLRTHGVPAWFSNAKFGIWAHWGAQSVAESGDWYARHLYGMQPGSADWERKRADRQHADHLERFGSPDTEGAKDLLPRWTAERFDAEALVALFVEAGARFIVSMAVHCDNIALWESTEQPWNTAAYGPKRDIVAEWERATRAAGLPFGLSFHNNWTWRWLDAAHGTDPITGRPHDGRLTAADGADLWWDGLDPRELYLEPHRPGAAPPAAWVDRFYRMATEATMRYQPDSVYFDDRRMPFDAGGELPASPPSDAGMRYLADYYRAADDWTPGSPTGIVSIKDVPDEDRTAVLLDSERRQLDTLQSEPWQFDTSDGEWFDCASDDPMFHQRKTPRQVLHLLIDVVSKNGTLLLNIPQRADGTVDDRARALLSEIGDWLRICGEGIYETTPWVRYGEGPVASAHGELALGDLAASYDEGERDFTAADIRFTRRDGALYATLLGWPADGIATIGSAGRASGLLEHEPGTVELLGHGPVPWTRTAAALVVELPEQSPTRHAHMIRIV